MKASARVLAIVSSFALLASCARSSATLDGDYFIDPGESTAFKAHAMDTDRDRRFMGSMELRIRGNSIVLKPDDTPATFTRQGDFLVVRPDGRDLIIQVNETGSLLTADVKSFRLRVSGDRLIWDIASADGTKKGKRRIVFRRKSN